MMITAVMTAVLGWTVLQPAQPEGADPFTVLRFMTGSWAGESGGERFEEVWSTPEGRGMLGMGRTIRAARTVSFEFLRITEQNGRVVYLASPNGREPTTFTLVEFAPNRAVFSNPEHDFPQRLVYERNGAELNVSIEGQGRVIRLRFRLVDGN